MIKFHPSDQVLTLFVEGKLSAPISLAVSAHIDCCEVCAAQVKTLEAASAAKWLEPEAPPLNVMDETAMANELDSMLASILDGEVALSEKDTTPTAFINDRVAVNGEVHEVPRALRRILPDEMNWRGFGGVHTMPLEVSDEFKVNLLHIGPDTHVPSHTHKGMEVTLVLGGTLSDEQGQYHKGDFIIKDASHEHSPSTAKESCLCLTVMDAPVKFTQGMSRLLNPFTGLLY